MTSLSFSARGTPLPRNQDSPTAAESSHDRDSDTDDGVDPAIFPDDYLPKDPWCMHVRWRKDGMFPPGTLHPNSAHSSHIDLINEDDNGRPRSSIIGGLSSAAGSATSIGGGIAGGGSGAALALTDNACYVYMDVQLYTLEADCYLVDFKCAGYETIVEAVINESEKALIGSGMRVADKDVTSPQPFLDLTNKLVIHLARG